MAQKTEEQRRALAELIRESESSNPVCDNDFKCPDWIEGVSQIEGAQMLAFAHKPFRFCPWCGRKIPVK